MDQPTAMIVDRHAGRRQALMRVLTLRGIRVHEAATAFDAMAALGRAEFAAIIIAEESRLLSLRGLCMLARKRHPSAALCILCDANTDVAALNRAVPVALELIQGGRSEMVADQIIALLGRPSALDTWAMDATAIHLAVEESRAELGDACTFEGVFEPGAGPALLMGILSQGLTGKLVVEEGPAAGALCFVAGEPVWSFDPQGDVGLWERVLRAGLLPPDFRVGDIPEGTLLSAVARTGQVAHSKLLDFARNLIRERVSALANQGFGHYTFREQQDFVAVVPLVRVNPFGLLLDVKRREFSPDRLHAESDAIAGLYVIPLSGFQQAATTLTSFLSAPGLEDFVIGEPQAADFYVRSGLGPLMGAVTLLTLAALHFIELAPSRRRREPVDAARSPALPLPALPPSEDPRLPVEDEINGLYLELKLLRDPAAILSVPAGAGRAVVEAAALRLLSTLNDQCLPPVPRFDELRARVVELRAKIEGARATLLKPRPTSQPPRHLGKYELLTRIGRGGMAEVFVGKQMGLEGFEKTVAIKRILPHLASDEQFISMFLSEARIAARLDHPNIVNTLDLGRADEDYFIVMEYVRGWDLHTILQRAHAAGLQMPTEIACQIVAHVCSALHAAHTLATPGGASQRILHRDVSPQNVLVSADGFVKLTDFGIAKAAGAAEATSPGCVRGKLLYITPERLSGGAADAAGDVFAAVITLYQCLTLTHPFARGSRELSVGALSRCEVLPISRELPVSVLAILSRGLALDPAERFLTAQSLDHALSAVPGAGQSVNAARIAVWLQDLFRATPGERPASVHFGDDVGTFPERLRTSDVTGALIHMSSSLDSEPER